MFSRIDGLFTITVNNLKALEAVSEWIYKMLKCTYLIQIEQFPNMTIYYICIPMRDDFDKKVKKEITKFIENRNIKLLEDKA